MPITIHLDYETRSERDIALGSFEYASDPSTRVMCLAALIDYGDSGRDPDWLVVRFDPNGPRNQPMPSTLALVWPEAEVWAWNVAFEQNITRLVLGWPEPGESWRCSMALAASHNLPQSLGAAAKFFGIDGKHEAGRKVMLKVCAPLKKTGQFYNPTEQEYSELAIYCRHDVELEETIAKRLPAMPSNEVAVWRACNAVNQRGMGIDRELCTAAIALTERVAEACDADVRQATAGAIIGADLTRLDYLLDWLGHKGFDLKDMKAGTVAAALRRKELPDFAKAILLARQKVARVSISKFSSMLAQTGTDSRLRGQLRYCGTQTGRWRSSGEHNHRRDNDSSGVQVQNLPKPPKGVAPETAFAAALAHDLPAAISAGGGAVDKALVSIVRPAIVPSEGQSLAIVDYASIEARIVLWLAEDERHLNWYRRADAGEGQEPYCLMASRIFGRPIDKERDPTERNIGKQAVLGCGYQMGATKFKATCEAFGVELEATGVTAEQVVKEYREEFPLLAAGKLVGLWSRLQAAALFAVNEHRPVKIGRLRFFWCDALDCFRLGLPSGRSIAYHNARVEWVEKDFGWGPKLVEQFMYDDYSDGYPVPVSMYGGMWTENATQAVARDLLAESLVGAEADGLNPILHAHDEMVCDVSRGISSLANLVGLMNEIPAWAIGLPIATEGYVSSRYAKKPWDSNLALLATTIGGMHA